MARKSTKAAGIMKLLKQGYTPAQIKDRMAVSDSYIHAVKKQMQAGVEAEVENDDAVVRPRAVGPHKVMRVTKAEQEAIKPKPGEFVQADTNVDAILDARGSRYGNFLDHARITQDIKRAMENSRNWATLPVDTREALEMTAHKIGRMLNGDPEYVDNVVDIIGYMQLVLDRMNGKVGRGIST